MSTRYNNKISEIRNDITELLGEIIKASKLALESYTTKNIDMFKEVEEQLNNLPLKGDHIDNEIIKTFALFGPEANELRFLVAYLKMTNEIVRISEGVKKYSRRMAEHMQSDCDLDPLNGTIVHLHKSTINAIEYIHECFEDLPNCNVEDSLRKVMVEESKNDDLFAVLEKEIMSLIIDSKELSTEYVKVLGTLRKLERSCDRSVNISNLIMYAKNGGRIHVYK